MKEIEAFLKALKAAGYKTAEVRKERVKTLRIVKGESRATTEQGDRTNVIATPASLVDEETKNFMGLTVLKASGLTAANVQAFGGELVFIGVTPEKK